MNNREKLQSNLASRYVLAMAFIAYLATTVFYSLNTTIDEAIQKVNIAQSMSQNSPHTKQLLIEATKKLLDAQSTELIAWIATLIILLLEIIFIFQPMVRHILELKNEKAKMLEENSALQTLAFHDPLTGLKNRTNLEEEIEVAIKRSSVQEVEFAVIMLDLDYFKDVNDTYGHDVGDVVLKEISQILGTHVRSNDSVFRVGGEEFVLLLNQVDLNNAKKVADKIRNIVKEKLFKIGKIEFKKTISGGLFHSSLSSGCDVKSILKQVDNALYHSKNSGRDQITTVS
ncbi:MAG: diguanylate cyclase [Helicobacteraceae bacterium]|nr:diguanylate cyclase [Helicobacteraceae bacterium]